jgi:two-component system, NarL family, sensor histidine kinase DevS
MLLTREPLQERPIALHKASLELVKDFSLDHLEERERTGMELHDGIIQSIYGVGLSLENVLHSFEDDLEDAKTRVQSFIESLNQAIRNLRAYILDLRLHQMGSEGLLSGLNRLMTEFRANTLTTVQLSSTDNELQDLPQAYSMALFHICQEALANIAKYAKATQVDISFGQRMNAC